MSASKILTTAVASATIVGAIGFAYAQTSDGTSNSAQGAPQAEQVQNPTAGPSTDSTAQPASPSMSSTPSTTDSSAAPSSSTDSNAAPASDMSTEPAPKADRN